MRHTWISRTYATVVRTPPAPNASSTGSCALGLWALWVRGSGFLVWAAFIVLGIPALFGAATPMLYRTANRIGAAMRSAISRAVEQPVAR